MNSLIIGLLIPLLGTMLGSAFVFFMKGDLPERVQKSLLGFASGVMVAASVWSLLIPAMEMEYGGIFPVASGFLLGMANPRMLWYDIARGGAPALCLRRHAGSCFITRDKLFYHT